MEELWKDISTFSSSHHHFQPLVPHQTSLHEFLASPTYQKTQISNDPKLPCWSDSKGHNKACSEKVAGHVWPVQESQGSGCSPCSYYTSHGREPEDENAGGDTRHKRKMKNRESATRSRARRQAYTTELEIELAQLREENAMLRRRQEEISSAAAVAQVPKKKTTLPRSFTAPF